MLPVDPSGAQRASVHPTRTRAIALALAALFGTASFLTGAQPVHAATAKVVIVVGPTGSKTSEYIDAANRIASQASGYGAAVYRVYSPNATWSRVKQVAYGADLFVYLGHGNGWPSPYAPYQPYTKNGLGLNESAGNGNYNLKYWGEYYVSRYLHLSPGAVVILHRLCYASGNSEWGSPDPTLDTAKKRVDNYGAGFLRTGANAVFAEAITATRYILYGLFRTNRTMGQIFWSSPDATGNYAVRFWSQRTSGRRAVLDPRSPGDYYRSFIGYRDMTATQWRR